MDDLRVEDSVQVDYRTLSDFGMTDVQTDPELMASYDKMLKKAVDTSTQMTKGELPDDVVEMVSRQAAEKAAAQGIGMGQAARSTTLRDLGMHSLQMSQAGLASSVEIGKLVETTRQFNETQTLKNREFLNQTRQLDIGEAELEQKRKMFNEEQGLALDELYLNLQQFSSELAFKYASYELKGDISKYSDYAGVELNALLESIEGVI